MSHVFISYLHDNFDIVKRLSDDLQRHGIKVWLDRNEIKPGYRWKESIQSAIRDGDFFIACFSKEYEKRDKTHMNEELTVAIEELRKFPTNRAWFIPALLSECNVPARSIGAGETLPDIQWVPLYENWDAGIKRILSVVKPIPVQIEKIINQFYSSNKKQRSSAVFNMHRVGHPAIIPILIEALQDADKEIRANAAFALGRNP